MSDIRLGIDWATVTSVAGCRRLLLLTQLTGSRITMTIELCVGGELESRGEPRTAALGCRYLLWTLTGALALAGCSGAPPKSSPAVPLWQQAPPAQYNPRASQALNIALATGLTDPVKGPLFDVSRADLPADIRSQPAPDVARKITRGLDLAMAADLFTGGARGMSLGSQNVLGVAYLISAVAGGPPKHPAAKAQEIVWMPRSMAPTATAAADLLKSITQQAVQKVLADQGWTIKTIQADTGGLMKTRIEALTTYVGGDVCGVRVHCLLKAYADGPAEAAATPSFAGGGPAWVWSNGMPGREKSFDRGFSWGISELDLNPPHTPNQGRQLMLDFEDLLLRMTKYMPAWVYVYRPPGKSRPYPRIYSQGNELTFIEPL